MIKRNGVLKPKDFYDYSPLMSRNAVFNMVIGDRGYGKTYGAKKLSIKAFLSRGEEMIYLRRYKSEQAGKGTFFNDIAHEFNGVEFRTNGNIGECRKPGDKRFKTLCYFATLSNALTLKGVSYPNVTKIIYDEFIILKGAIRYLPEEVTAFNEFYSTVDRWQDKTRALFLGNATSIYNPYFTEYGIEPHGEEWITRSNGFIVAHFPQGDTFANAVYKTRFGQFIKGTDYASYSLGSKFADNTGYLMADKPAEARYELTLETSTGIVTMWSVNKYTSGRVWYASSKRIAGVGVGFTMVSDHVNSDVNGLDNGSYMLSSLRSSYNRAQVFFTDSKAKQAFLGIFKRVR